MYVCVCVCVCVHDVPLLHIRYLIRPSLHITRRVDSGRSDAQVPERVERQRRFAAQRAHSLLLIYEHASRFV